MKTTIARLKFAMKDREKAWNRKILKKELAQAAEVTSAAVSNWWNNENTTLEAKCVFGLAKFLGVSAIWLESGQGGMLPLPDGDERDRTNIGGKNVLIPELETAGKHTITGKKSPAFGNVERIPDGRREIPVISYVQAGMMSEALDPFSLGEGFETITVDFPCSEHTFALRIKGKSMLPKFEEGDVIVVDPFEQAIPGSFVIAKNSEEEATFKKYRAIGVDDHGNAVFELVPLNDDFATLHSVKDHLRIIGVAIEHRKKLLR